MGGRTLFLGLLLCLISVSVVALAISCDDANPCTIDKYDERMGCTHTPASFGTICGTDMVCNGQGLCTKSQPETTCGNQRLDSGEECEPIGSYKCEGYKKYLCSEKCTWSFVGCHSYCQAPCTSDADCTIATAAQQGYCNLDTCKCEYQQQSVKPICGNQICETGETQDTCCMDCWCPAGSACQCPVTAVAAPAPSQCTCTPTQTQPTCGNQRLDSGEECEPIGTTACLGYQKKQCSSKCTWQILGCSRECGAQCESDAQCQATATAAAGGYCDTKTCKCVGSAFLVCPADCTCLTAEDAKAKGLISCTGTTTNQLCGVSPDGMPMFCFTQTQQPPIAACPEGCSCMTKSEAERLDFDFCEGIAKVCEPSTTGEVKYCFGPKPTGACPAGCNCMMKEDAINKWGYEQARERLCGDMPTCYLTDTSGAQIQGYCFKGTVESLCPADCRCMLKEDAIKQAGTSSIEQFMCSREPCNYIQVATADATGAQVISEIPLYCFKIKPIENYCGNGYCEYGEDIGNCCMDCGCKENLICVDNQCQKPTPTCPSDSFCVSRDACVQKGCKVMEGYACRVTIPAYGTAAAVGIETSAVAGGGQASPVASVSEINVPDVVCCKCPERPEPSPCERKGGFCINFQRECPEGFEETQGLCPTRSEKCCIPKVKPPVETCESKCKDRCVKCDVGTKVCELDQECFKICMQDCNPQIPVACNFNGRCEEGEDWKYCCTDCVECIQNGYLCDKESGACMPRQIQPGIEGAGDLAKALNRLADVLEKLINLLSGIFGKK